MKVLIIEALVYLRQPLAASELSKVFEKRFDTPFISYHVVELANAGLLMKVGEETVRGTIKKTYFFSPTA